MHVLSLELKSISEEGNQCKSHVAFQPTLHYVVGHNKRLQSFHLLENTIGRKYFQEI